MNDYYASYFVIVVAIADVRRTLIRKTKKKFKKKKLKLYTKKMNEKE